MSGAIEHVQCSRCQQFMNLADFVEELHGDAGEEGDLKFVECDCGAKYRLLGVSRPTIVHLQVVG